MQVVALKSTKRWISPFDPSSCDQTKGWVLPVLWVGFAGFSFVLFLGIVAAQFAKWFVLLLCPEAYVYVCVPHALTCLPAI